MPVEILRLFVVFLLGIPAAAAVLVALMGSRRASAIRWVSLSATIVSFLLAIVLAGSFARVRLEEQQSTEKAAWRNNTFLPEFVPGAPGISKRGEDFHNTSWELLRFGENPGDPAIQFYVGLDGLNVGLVVLTAVLMISAVLVSWTAIRDRVPEFYAWLLILETGMLGVFLAFDIILFYVFFELTLVPLFFLIGIWGGPQRRDAARKFFIYTLTGSVFTLLGVLGIALACYHDEHIRELTFSIPRLVHLVNDRLIYLHTNVDSFAAEAALWRHVQTWVFLAIMAGFAIKVPLVPLHTWLPLAHVEAPTAGSVLLAGVLLKIGAYGFLRLCVPLAPDAAVEIGVPLISALAVIGIVYGSFCALAQTDIKKLVAYSSVSHLGFCMLGMFALNVTGLSGSLLQMINHGLSTGGLFLIVGMLYERYHTRMMSDFGGLGVRLRLLTCFMVFICFTSVGLPGLNGFVGEALILMGVFDHQWLRGQWPWMAVVGSSGIVLGAWYLLTLLMRVFFGPLKEPHVPFEHNDHDISGDLTPRETIALMPIVLLCLVLGVYPQPFLDVITRDIGVVAGLANQAKERVPLAARPKSDAENNTQGAHAPRSPGPLENTR